MRGGENPPCILETFKLHLQKQKQKEMEGIAEFDMLWNGQLETFNVEFEYEVFFDCYVTGEAGSDFLDWEYRTKELYFENEEGETVIVDHNLLRP